MFPILLALVACDDVDKPETDDTAPDTGDEVIVPDSTVCADGTADFATIQEAINTAQDTVVPFDLDDTRLIQICAGTYYENLQVGKEGYTTTIALVPEEGASVIIDGSHTAPVLELTGASVKVDGNVTLQHGVGGINMNYLSNRETHVYQPSILTLSGGVTIDDNDADDAIREFDNGGGISVGEYNSLSLGDVTISNNHALENGGGLFVGEGSEVTIDGTVVLSGNTATNGAGLYADSSSLTTSEDTTLKVTNNVAEEEGGGAYLHSVTGTLNNMTMTENQSYTGAALYVSNTSDVSMSNLTASSNTSDARGAVVYTDYQVALNVDGCVVNDNYAGSLGNIYVQGGSVLAFENCSFTNNVAYYGWDDEVGGLTYLSDDGTDPSISFTASTFSGNEDCDVYALATCTQFDAGNITATCTNAEGCVTE